MQELIEKARLRRKRLFGLETNAYRLVDGGGDGCDGLIVDDFAGHWLVQTLDRPFPAELQEAGAGLFRSLWWKRPDGSARRPPQWIAGERIEAPFPVLENQCRFLVDLCTSDSPGIFLDQRLNRAEIAGRAGTGASLLNCFSYTCAFSIVAAKAGAETVSVDLSGKALEWGRSNFAANALDASPHAFCKGDTFEWLRRFHRAGRMFDGVILDPPTFSRNHKGKVFRVEKDYARLAESAAKVVKPGGWLLCCTNCRGLEADAFAGMLRMGLRDASRRIQSMRAGEMPQEYRGEKYLKSQWIAVA